MIMLLPVLGTATMWRDQAQAVSLYYFSPVATPREGFIGVGFRPGWAAYPCSIYDKVLILETGRGDWNRFMESFLFKLLGD